jgi:hypothetical protein
MSFTALNLLFPVVLAIHNFEEYSRYDDFVRAYHARWPAKFRARPVMRDAAVLLTLAVAVLDGLTYFYKGAVLVAISEIAIFALMLNGVAHCILSLKGRSWIPGTLSAVALVLPYSAIAIASMRFRMGESIRSLVVYAVLGGLATPLAIALFLSISYGFSLLKAD